MVKSVAQQDLLALHKVRAQLVKSRTALCNQLRGLLSELAAEWAWAMDTPFKWMKQVASHRGRTAQGVAMSRRCQPTPAISKRSARCSSERGCRRASTSSGVWSSPLQVSQG